MEELSLALLLNEKKEELKKKNIIIENGSFKLNKTQLKKLENSLNENLAKKRKFSKNTFSEKNPFLYNSVKNKLEELGCSFKPEEELEEELEKYKKELLEEEENAKKELEEKEKKKN